ncbi:enoyl-CoA hydratase/isomerase family protein [Myxococcota bacterium]|nr:enoyl-CoA hydratase/isomerase family protein [Myxococcota bacterium]
MTSALLTLAERRALRAEFNALGGEGQVRLHEEADGLAVLTLDHPEASNALSGPMIAALDEAVDALAEGEGRRALLIRAAGGRTFCAGADLKVVRAQVDKPEFARWMSRFMRDLTERVAALPLVSAVALDGAAIGGGAELCTCADWRFIAQDATIRFVHARLGISPGWGGGGRLTRLVGRGAALRLLTTARQVSAEEALAMGLVDGVAPPGEAEALARATLGELLVHPAGSVRALKGLVHAADRLDPVAAAEVEAEAFVRLWGGEDMKHALARSGKGRG